MIYINLPTRKVGVLSSPSAATAELQTLVGGLLAKGEARRYFSREGNPQRSLFGISLPDYAADRDLAADLSTEAQHNQGLVPPGTSVLLIARPSSAVGSEVPAWSPPS